MLARHSVMLSSRSRQGQVRRVGAVEDCFLDVRGQQGQAQDPRGVAGAGDALKGIGFRSVLEISERPKIWSRQTESSPCFDGYCFGFDPEFVKSIHAPVLAILEGRPLSDDQRWFAKIMDEDPGLHERLRADVQVGQEHGTASIADWLREEIGYLSPYLLPWPLTERGAVVEDFENRGFASVVALPLGSATAVSLVESRLAEISAESMLFLDNLKVLTIATPHGSRTFQRCVVQNAIGDPRSGQRLSSQSASVPSCAAFCCRVATSWSLACSPVKGT